MRFYVVVLSLYSVLATVLVVALGLENFNLKNPEPAPPVEVDYQTVRQIDLGDAPRRGPENAPITMVVFSDYECSYCRRGQEVIARIMGEYDGQIQLAMKNFPLSFHKKARPAAAAALAAHEQGRFWEMHELLFHLQDVLGPEEFVNAASYLELDADQFQRDMQEERWRDRINRELDQGSLLGVRGTPTVFVNGVMAPVVSYEQLSQIIEKFLAANGQPSETVRSASRSP